MYIFIKIFDNDKKDGISSQPFIIEDNNLTSAICRIIEKYYNIKIADEVKEVLK